MFDEIMVQFIGTFYSLDPSTIWRWSLYNHFLTFSTPLKLIGMGNLKCVGTQTRSSIFEVKSYCKVLTNRNPHFFFPWKSIWKVKVPTKVAFFMWTTDRGKILSMDNL
jgi:hypothetical protein